VKTHEEMPALAKEAHFLLEGRPPKPEVTSLIVACALLTAATMDAKKLGWLDGLCLVMALGNLALYLYRWWRDRVWTRRRNAYVKRIHEMQEGAVDG